MLATRGLIGVAAYLTLLGAAAWRINFLLRQEDRTHRGIGLGLLLGMIAIVTYSFVQHLYYIQGTQIFFWALIAIASIAWPRSAITSPAALRVSWLAPLVLSAAVVFQLASSLPLIRRAAADIARLPRGFHGIEHWQPTGETMRWSLRQGILCLYPTSPVIALKLLTANPAVVGNPITVTLWADHRVLDRIEIASTQPVVRSLHLMEWSGGATPESTGQAHFGECRPGRKPLRLTVDVSRVWSPLSIRTGHDARHLGVAVFQPSFSGVSP